VTVADQILIAEATKWVELRAQKCTAFFILCWMLFYVFVVACVVILLPFWWSTLLLYTDYIDTALINDSVKCFIPVFL